MFASSLFSFFLFEVSEARDFAHGAAGLRSRATKDRLLEDEARPPADSSGDFRCFFLLFCCSLWKFFFPAILRDLSVMGGRLMSRQSTSQPRPCESLLGGA